MPRCNPLSSRTTRTRLILIACIPRAGGGRGRLAGLPRIAHFGNPKAYNNFKDESLNLVLRTVVQHSHRSCWQYRVFYFFALQGMLGLNVHLFGSVDLDFD